MEFDWDEVERALGDLITGRLRPEVFAHSQTYLERLGLLGKLHHVNVLHIAGTKGKGSTAAFTSEILVQSGYKVGLFTSPHLCDVRERIRIDGKLVSRDNFARIFWRCREKLQPIEGDDTPFPGYFKFLTYMALELFIEADVDVIVLEVGIGGRLDGTNVIPFPVATAVTTLDYDHMELLGDTLAKIAREKAGIFRPAVPAYTTDQAEEAMESLEECAAEVGCPLFMTRDLALYEDQDVQLGLHGDFQKKNAAIAVALSRALDTVVSSGKSKKALSSDSLQSMAADRVQQLQSGLLPDTYLKGLAACKFDGRAQIAVVPASSIIADEVLDTPLGARNGVIGESPPVTFFLDGAHTPESCAACASWFYSAACTSKADEQLSFERILIFNCFTSREPDKLLGPIARAAHDDCHFNHALFVPADSSYSSVIKKTDHTHVEVGWQTRNSLIWESMESHAVNVDPVSNSLKVALGSLLPR